MAGDSQQPESRRMRYCRHRWDCPRDRRAGGRRQHHAILPWPATADAWGGLFARLRHQDHDGPQRPNSRSRIRK